MLGQPLSMLLPEVIGFQLTGRLAAGVTATDLVLTVTQMLRQKGCRRQIRRVLRAGPQSSFARRSRDHRQYGAGIWRDLRLLPHRFGDALLSGDFGPHAGPRRPRRGLCKGARALSHQDHTRSGLHRYADPRNCDRSCRRWPAPNVPRGGSRSARSARASRPRSTPNTKSQARSPSVTRSRERISISATAMW